MPGYVPYAASVLHRGNQKVVAYFTLTGSEVCFCVLLAPSGPLLMLDSVNNQNYCMDFSYLPVFICYSVVSAPVNQLHTHNLSKQNS